jgi:hypothetical protein
VSVVCYFVTMEIIGTEGPNIFLTDSLLALFSKITTTKLHALTLYKLVLQYITHNVLLFAKGIPHNIHTLHENNAYSMEENL